MYVPKAFAETDPHLLSDFISAHPLATLVSFDAGGLGADHIPMLLVRDPEGRECLQGHVARANPLWRSIGACSDVLAVFQDAGMYITPSWYASKAETHKVVPTWNYIAVHVYGTARAVDDPTWLESFLTRLVTVNESLRADPWRLTDAPKDYVASQLKAIVGIEIAVTRWLGKWKVSQNRPPRDVDGVIAGLRGLDDPASHRMAEAVVTKRGPR